MSRVSAWLGDKGKSLSSGALHWEQCGVHVVVSSSTHWHILGQFLDVRYSPDPDPHYSAISHFQASYRWCDLYILVTWSCFFLLHWKLCLAVKAAWFMWPVTNCGWVVCSPWTFSTICLYFQGLSRHVIPHLYSLALNFYYQVIDNSFYIE